MPALPDHWDVIEEADEEHPFRLATRPARNFLNSTFTETPTSLRAGRGGPTVLIHPDDAAAARHRRRRRGRARQPPRQVALHARLFDGVRRGVLIAENRSGRTPPIPTAAASTR